MTNIERLKIGMGEIRGLDKTFAIKRHESRRFISIHPIPLNLYAPPFEPPKSYEKKGIPRNANVVIKEFLRTFREDNNCLRHFYENFQALVSKSVRQRMNKDIKRNSWCPPRRKEDYPPRRTDIPFSRILYEWGLLLEFERCRFHFAIQRPTIGNRARYHYRPSKKEKIAFTKRLFVCIIQIALRAVYVHIFLLCVCTRFK